MFYQINNFYISISSSETRTQPFYTTFKKPFEMWELCLSQAAFPSEYQTQSVNELNSL